MSGEKKREVYDAVEKKMRVMLFLRLNLNNKYNYGMGGAGIAEQLHGT